MQIYVYFVIQQKKFPFLKIYSGTMSIVPLHHSSVSEIWHCLKVAFFFQRCEDRVTADMIIIVLLAQ